MNTNEVTKQWVINYEPYLGRNHYIIWIGGEGKIGDIIASKQDVELIKTAVLSCQSINPESPLLVAQAIPDMVKALIAAINLLNGYVSANDNEELKTVSRQVLKSIEGRE